MAIMSFNEYMNEDNIKVELSTLNVGDKFKRSVEGDVFEVTVLGPIFTIRNINLNKWGMLLNPKVMVYPVTK